MEHLDRNLCFDSLNDYTSDCSDLMAPTHGSLSSKVAFHGHHVTVSCAHGYKLSGDNILVCSSGSWSGIVGACVEDEGNRCTCMQYFMYTLLYYLKF